jgi:hypothetical protein
MNEEAAVCPVLNGLKKKTEHVNGIVMSAVHRD